MSAKFSSRNYASERTQILNNHENDDCFDDDLETDDLGFRYDHFSKKSQVLCQKRTLFCYGFSGLILSLVIGIVIGRFTAPTSKTVSQLPSGSRWIYNFSIQQQVIKELKTENIKENLKTLTSKPHLAGSDQDEKQLVNFIKDRFESYLDAAEVFPYDVLLSFPNETDKNYAGLVYPNGSVIKKSNPFEKPVTGQKKSSNVTSAFNAYSPPGHVKGNLQYVNYGRRKDFEEIAERGINLTDAICIARYGLIFRGDKAKFAKQHNCAALIMYTDPLDYAGVDLHSWDPSKGDNFAYPNSWWMPSSGFQRGTLGVHGDPLTRGYPALNLTYRIPLNKANLPQIPVLPISYADAYQYLSILNGTDAPDDWQGGFNVTYKFGGSFVDSHADCKAMVHVANYLQRKTVHTVIGYIRGWLEPDRYVIMGNHRDAWTFGGADPNSGTAVVLEVSRAIAKVAKEKKWRPRRTIIFCNWAAEEFGLIGSTEWVEQMEKRLLIQAVSYLNIDIAVQGNKTFRAFGCPSLQQLLFNVTKSVKNPNSKEAKVGRNTVYDTWLHYIPDKIFPNRPFIHNLGSGSDYTFFLQNSGVASMDIRYTFDNKMNVSSYPVYHSIHDTFDYFEKWLDPDFNLSLAIASISADVILQQSDSAVLPLNISDTAVELKIMADFLNKTFKDIFKGELSLNELYRVIHVFKESADKLMRHAMKLNSSTSEIQLRMINDKLLYINRGFLDFNGLPSQREYRNVVFAPSTENSYSGAGFPAVTDAAFDAQRGGSLGNVKKELAILCLKILSAAQLMNDF